MIRGLAIVTAIVIGGAADRASSEALDAAAQGAVGLEIVGQVGGAVNAVDVAGDYAYVGVGRRLHTVDVSNPQRPTLLARTPLLPYYVNEVRVSGAHAFVISGRQYLLVFDVANPEAPRQVARVSALGSSAVQVVDGYAYVASGSDGLRIFDVSDPVAPRQIGLAPHPDSRADSQSMEVQVAGDLAYVADGYGGLVILDVSDRTTPHMLSHLETTGWVGAVSVSGQFAYLGDIKGFVVVDVSTPDEPKAVAQADGWGSISAVEVVGSLAYLVARDESPSGSGILVVDVSDPFSPILVGSIETPLLPQALHIEGEYGFVADAQDGLLVMDVSDHSAPRMVGAMNTLGSAGNVHLAGKHAFIAGSHMHRDGGWPYQHGQLHVVDISDPTEPRLVGAVDVLGSALDLDVSGSYAYVAAGSAGLKIVDVADPTAPRHAGEVDVPGVAHSVSVSGSRAFVIFNYDPLLDEMSTLQIIDVAEPSTPSVTGELEVSGGFATDVHAVGDVAYVVTWRAGLRVIDVSDPTSPRETGAVETPGRFKSVHVSGAHAYLYEDASYGPDRLRIVDVTDAAAPRQVGKVDVPDSVSCSDVHIGGSRAFLACGERGGLRVIDVSEPSDPQQESAVDTPGLAASVHVAGTYAYVADGDAGLLVVQHRNLRHAIHLPAASRPAR